MNIVFNVTILYCKYYGSFVYSHVLFILNNYNPSLLALTKQTHYEYTVTVSIQFRCIITMNMVTNKVTGNQFT